MDEYAYIEKLKEIIKQQQQDLDQLSTDGYTYYLDQDDRVHRDDRARYFVMTETDVHYLIRDLRDQQVREVPLVNTLREQIETQRNRMNLISAENKQLLEQVQEIRRINATLVNIKHVLMFAQEALTPTVPIQRCEINVCEDDDQSCHCMHLDTCNSLVKTFAAEEVRTAALINRLLAAQLL